MNIKETVETYELINYLNTRIKELEHEQELLTIKIEKGSV